MAFLLIFVLIIEGGLIWAIHAVPPTKENAQIIAVVLFTLIIVNWILAFSGVYGR